MDFIRGQVVNLLRSIGTGLVASVGTAAGVVVGVLVPGNIFDDNFGCDSSQRTCTVNGQLVDAQTGLPLEGGMVGSGDPNDPDNEEGHPLIGANFAQKTYGNNFSSQGKFAGQTVDDVAAALRSGKLQTSDVPIDYIVRNGNTLILNTRSSQALTRAGIPRSQWIAVNRTGNAAYEARLTGQLSRNKLTEAGVSKVRQSGGF